MMDNEPTAEQLEQLARESAAAAGATFEDSDQDADEDGEPFTESVPAPLAADGLAALIALGDWSDARAHDGTRSPAERDHWAQLTREIERATHYLQTLADAFPGA